MLCILLLLTSMFFFPEPSITDEKVSTFLAYEKQWIQGSWPAGKILSVLLVPISLFSLGASLWKRSFSTALVLLACMAIGKIAWAIVGSSGAARAIAPPALAGLAICAQAFMLLKKG